MTLKVHEFICLQDNYGYLAHHIETGATASVDAPDGDAILAQLAAKGWTLTDILITHHHPDHVQGISTLKATFPDAVVVGPKKEAAQIPGVQRQVVEGDVVRVGGAAARVIETPGHTIGHVVYHFADDAVAFTGDTLFSLGCGRVFATTMDVMYESLMKISDLPQETLIYCGHEYTAANARFALTIEPDNAILQERARNVDVLRAAGKFSMPSTLTLERAANPFLRCEEPDLLTAIGLEDADPASVFATLRERKDRF